MKRDADKSGIGVQAWLYKGPQEGTKPDHAASLRQWVLTGQFHPAWSWWVIGCVSLADLPGVPRANKQYPGAEHEIMIASLDPRLGEPDPDEPESVHPLMPLDLQFHFDGVSDEQAAEITDLMVDAICAGKMSPDSDYRANWLRSLETTVRHYKEGRH